MQSQWQPGHEFESLYYANKDRLLMISWHPIKENQITCRRGCEIFWCIKFLSVYTKFDKFGLLHEEYA
jgi:hypothetical protein